MSILDRLFNRSLPASRTKSEVRSQPGPLTVHEAWAFAMPEAQSLDANAQLILITSGTDIQRDGRSFTWEFLFHLPNRKARLLSSLGPSEASPDQEQAPVVMVNRVTQSTEKKPVRGLPFEFRNSPEVVEELSLSGVDFVAGPTDMKLEARILSTGEAVWMTYYWSEERLVAFQTPAS
ncbi:MAG: hypothetical protein R6W88_17100 [Desulfobacterales bacterium]